MKGKSHFCGPQFDWLIHVLTIKAATLTHSGVGAISELPQRPPALEAAYVERLAMRCCTGKSVGSDESLPMQCDARVGDRVRTRGGAHARDRRAAGPQLGAEVTVCVCARPVHVHALR